MPSSNLLYSEYAAAEREYYKTAAIINDDPPEFATTVFKEQIRLYVDSLKFAIGDIVRIKDGAQDWWAVVKGLGNDDIGSYITVVGQSGDKWLFQKGLSAANYGRVGEGESCLTGLAPR